MLIGASCIAVEEAGWSALVFPLFISASGIVVCLIVSFVATDLCAPSSSSLHPRCVALLRLLWMRRQVVLSCESGTWDVGVSKDSSTGLEMAARVLRSGVGMGE